MVHVPGRLAIAEDIFDRSSLQDRGQVIWDHIFDAGIGRAGDGALVNGIPGGDPIAEQKGMPFLTVIGTSS